MPADLLPIALDTARAVWAAVDWPVAGFVLVSGLVVMDYGLFPRAKIPLSRFGFALVSWALYSGVSIAAEIAAGQFDWLSIPRRIFAFFIASLAYDVAKRRGWIQSIRERQRKGPPQ